MSHSAFKQKRKSKVQQSAGLIQVRNEISSSPIGGKGFRGLEKYTVNKNHNDACKHILRGRSVGSRCIKGVSKIAYTPNAAGILTSGKRRDRNYNTRTGIKTR